MLVCRVPINAQAGGAAYYRYDANGRLTTVLSPTGEAAVYNYDAAGNFTSITRYAANQLSILDFTPGAGGINTQVTIFGTGFNTTASANTVKFNGVTATVTAATNIQLTVTVPTGATTGLINIFNTNGTVNSNSSFYVTGNVEFSNSIAFGEAKPFTFAQPPPFPAQMTNVGIMTFDGIANQRVSLTIEDLLSCLLRTGQAYQYGQISLISPAGANLVTVPIRNYWFGYPPTYLPPNFNVQTPLGFAWLENMALPATGKYTILIDPTDTAYANCGTNTPIAFGATVRLYDVTPDINGTIAASGQPLPVSFSAPGQNAVYTFSGFNGQRICLQGSQDVSTLINTDVKLFAPGAYPNGAPLATLIDTFFLDTTTLTANGTYTIFLDPQLNKARALTLNLYDVPPDVSTAMTVYSLTVPPPPNPLPTNQKTLLTIPSVGQAANLTFSVPGSQSVTIHIRQLKIIAGVTTSSTLTLSTQSGTQISTQTINYGADYTIPQTLSPGNYVIKIDPHQAAIGSLEIILTTP
ncbi:MAG: IPT/TIG domain-containing protein [Blastocatellia bacterium]